MHTSIYDDSVVRQAADIPGVYGNVDFTIVPERYDTTAAPDDARFAPVRDAIARVLDQPDLMTVIRDATMRGDRWADAGDGPPVLYRHRACGQIAHVEPTCSECGGPMHADDIDILPGPGARV